jgi:hypothetical protein
VPTDIPVSTPAPACILAINVAELLHIPPVVADARVSRRPTHKLRSPVIGAGAGSTVIENVTKQLVVAVNVIVAVPAETPVTVPDTLTDATDGLLLLQLPLPEANKVVVCPTQTKGKPVILPGNGTTVTVFME